MIELISSDQIGAFQGSGLSTFGRNTNWRYVGSGKYLTIPPGYSWVSLDWRFVFILAPHGLSTDSASFDWLEPDLFGDNIHYPNVGLYHKWTSIVNRKASGTLLCADATDLSVANKGFYYFTSSNPSIPNAVPIKFPGTAAYGRSLEGFYGITPASSARNYLEQLIVTGVHTFPSEEKGWYYVASWGRLYGLHSVQDQKSFLSYRLSVTEQLSVSVSKVYYDGKVVHRRLAKSTLPVMVFVTDSARLMNGRAVEEAELLAPSLEYGDEVTFKPTTLRPLPPPTLRAPNYDAIFNSADRNPKWHQLAASAYQSLGFADINGIAYLKDAGEFGRACTSFARTLKSIPSSRVRGAASAWLASHYGFKLMLADTLELRDTLAKAALRNSRKSKCQASTQYHSALGVSYEARYQVFYDEYAKVQSLLEELLLQSDAVITAENLWDMVPYSFIIDWFINIGDVLTSLDNYSKLIQTHDVICCGQSIKGTIVAKPSQLGLDERYTTNGIYLSYYARRYNRSLLYPSFLPSVTVNPFNHLVEGAALVVSRK